MFDSKGAMGFKKDGSEIHTTLGLLNSVVAAAYLKLFSPTLDFKVGDIILIPELNTNKKKDTITLSVQNCIDLTHSSYEKYETNWDFKEHPLI